MLGTGDYKKDSEDSLKWEEMRREKFRLQRSDYEFETSFGDALGKRRTYGWRVEDSWVKTMYRCVDEEGRCVASMLSGGMCNWKKGGEIETGEGLDKKLEELLVVSALAIWAAECGWSIFKGYGNGESGSDGGSSAAGVAVVH